MWDEEIESSWRQLAEEVILGMKEWRLQHPRATLTEMEEALDGLWARARGRFLQDVALASAAREIGDVGGDGGSLCPQCWHPLESRGQKTRSLSTYYDQCITLKRSYGVCPSCGTGFFPPG
jgi:hypothetical protein